MSSVSLAGRKRDPIPADFSFLTKAGFYVRSEPVDDALFQAEATHIYALNAEQKRDYLERLSKTIFFFETKTPTGDRIVQSNASIHQLEDGRRLLCINEDVYDLRLEPNNEVFVGGLKDNLILQKCQPKYLGRTIEYGFI
jgi:hypothetical protein